MIIAELTGPLLAYTGPGMTTIDVTTTRSNETIVREAVEEVEAEVTRYCYKRIPLREEFVMHDIQFLPLRQGSVVPRRAQCNGVTVAKIYDESVGYVLDFSV